MPIDMAILQGPSPSNYAEDLRLHPQAVIRLPLGDTFEAFQQPLGWAFINSPLSLFSRWVILYTSAYDLLSMAYIVVSSVSYGVFTTLLLGVRWGRRSRFYVGNRSNHRWNSLVKKFPSSRSSSKPIPGPSSAGGLESRSDKRLAS